jgi:diadenosine tetraphosphatase ApaH/serine/threonine PP2A family protein phosphatase
MRLASSTNSSVYERTIVIGDVHGCIAELEDLVRVCRVRAGDRVVLVGDLVAKGPESRKVVEYARDMGMLAVRGNHDEALIRWKAASDKGKGKELPRLSRSSQEALDQLKPGQLAWLATLPYYLELDEQNVVVHGGFAPGVKLEKQDPDVMVSLRSILPNGRLSERATEGAPWASQWKGPRFVLFGHDAIRGLQRRGHALGLDTGCVYGRTLTAAILPERRLVAVPARRAYTEVRRAESA